MSYPPIFEEHSSVPFTHIEQSSHRGDLSEFLLRKGQEARSWSLGPDSPCWSTCFALGMNHQGCRGSSDKNRELAPPAHTSSLFYDQWDTGLLPAPPHRHCDREQLRGLMCLNNQHYFFLPELRLPPAPIFQPNLSSRYSSWCSPGVTGHKAGDNWAGGATTTPRTGMLDSRAPAHRNLSPERAPEQNLKRIYCLV